MTPADPSGPEDPAFALRIVRLGGAADDPGVRRHLEFSASIGFNAVWVPGARTGEWTSSDGPHLYPEFLELLRWCQARDLRVFVALNPVVESAGTFVFDREEHRKRLLKFVRLLRRRTTVRDLAVSFQGAPLRLTELQDLMRFGRVAAPAHVELTHQVRRKADRSTRVWFEPAISNDRLLDDPRLRYASLLLEALPRLDSRVGIVWSGTEPASRELTAADLAATRRRLGQRELLLQDRFPANHGGGRAAISLVLGPLRRRDPAIADQVAGYLACPMEQLAASRLSLLTIADFLRAPELYDPDRSWKAARRRLAGDDPAAMTALTTQALEWGGWIGERNYHTVATDNPETAAVSLRDPAATASWQWPARRYPERMADLGGLADTEFRDELLEIMSRRLAIARAVPTARELRARLAAGRTDVAHLIEQLRVERERAGEGTGALLALDRFLAFSGVANLVTGGAAPDE